jgi:two-component system, cell cycle response regulator DivK
MTRRGRLAAVRRILLVEDDADNRTVFMLALRHGGFSVLCCADGETAVRLAQREVPDLILMDLALPKLDGWEATARIKANPVTRRIPVVALTAHVGCESRERAARAGIDAYLTKPIGPAALIRRVVEVLNDDGFRRCSPPSAEAPAPTGFLVQWHELPGRQN